MEPTVEPMPVQEWGTHRSGLGRSQKGLGGPPAKVALQQPAGGDASDLNPVQSTVALSMGRGRPPTWRPRHSKAAPEDGPLVISYLKLSSEKSFAKMLIVPPGGHRLTLK